MSNNWIEQIHILWYNNRNLHTQECIWEDLGKSASEIVKVSYSWAKQYVSCSNKVTKAHLQPKISPSSLSGNWICLRTYGVVKVDRGFAAGGGVLRDQSERWIVGFNKYLGFCSIIEADFWGIKDGLKLLLEWNYNNALIQTNSIEAINAIQDQVPNGSDSALVRRIHQLLSKIEHWIIRHIPREDNKKADGITKLVQERRKGLQAFEVSLLGS
ncbi:hypothetical protein J1N35_018544 [Gossypium stocksii]|uniref:RNase H type-1 domain-containing protein n=1 Tax=Gossypium stocksii TaxID=47602 RepID=A0A9D3VQJ3_9ROSI|nr:hypothetical protein J1N35_018544 [Gossypium stocksii]